MEKNTSLSRNYHDLTSHYNVYFNGEEGYKQGIEKAKTSINNDYTDFLPVFLYEDESVHSSLTPGYEKGH